MTEEKKTRTRRTKNDDVKTISHVEYDFLMLRHKRLEDLEKSWAMKQFEVALDPNQELV